MKVQEYLEKKLLADHGEADEQERPGISGGRAGGKQTGGVPDVHAQTSTDEPVAQSGRICPDSFCQGRPAEEQTNLGQAADDSTTRTRVSGKRPAEEVADDSGRGDRSEWRNFIEASSSSQAPSPSMPNMEQSAIGAAAYQVGGDVISDVAPTNPRVSGGMKRPQEDHAAMEYDGSEVEVKAQRSSSICLGIGSDDITGEMNAEGYEADIRSMAGRYQEALEDKQCFVQIRAKRSSNKDLRM